VYSLRSRNPKKRIPVYGLRKNSRVRCGRCSEDVYGRKETPIELLIKLMGPVILRLLGCPNTPDVLVSMLLGEAFPADLDQDEGRGYSFDAEKIRLTAGGGSAQ